MKGRCFMQKKWIALWISFLLILCIETALPVSASGAVDWGRTGTVSVTLKDGDSAVFGAEITLYKVAEAESLNSNLYFSFTDAFADIEGTPGEFRNTSKIRYLADYAVKQNISGKTLRTDENGFVCFDNLSLGLYLAVQTGSVQGYSDCAPFLMTIPTETDSEWIYDIDATPKTDIVRLVDITVKKVWNDDSKHRPESVTVQLRNGDTVIDTITLKEENGWSHTWTGQPKSDAWSVKEINVPKGYIASYQINGFTYTVTNTATLIQTGQLKWPIPLLAGVGMLLFAGGWILYFKGKRKDRA